MRKLVLAGLIVATIVFAGCQPYGKKVKINENMEVYVKGEATEEEAKKLGDYIASFDPSGTNHKSIQLSKDSGIYTVRFVVAENDATDMSMDDSFRAVRELIKENILPGQQVRMILTDDKFNDKRIVEEGPSDSGMPPDTTTPGTQPIDTLQ